MFILLRTPVNFLPFSVYYFSSSRTEYRKVRLFGNGCPLLKVEKFYKKLINRMKNPILYIYDEKE